MKKTLSFLLAAVLAVGIFPFSVFAHSTETQITPDDLYVTDGLVVWCDAFDAENAPTSGSWKGTYGQVNLLGSWRKAENGKGISYANNTYYTQNNLTGIEISPEHLDGEYTVEAVLSVIGLTDPETEERYIVGDGNALSHDLAVEFGPFKAKAYTALAGVTDSLALQYYYAANGGMANSSGMLTWNSFLGMEMGDAFTYSLTHRVQDGASLYTVGNNGNTANSVLIAAEDVVPMHYSDGRARLFCYFPIELYGIRVYDRALNDAERAQNHFADLCKYHGVDLSLFWHMLNESEQRSLMTACANVTFYDGVHAFGSVISSFLYAKLGAEKSFADVAAQYSLDILAYLAAEDKAAFHAALDGIGAGLDKDAVQRYFDCVAQKRDAAEALLSFVGFDALSQEEPEVRASFAVDTGLLSVLKQKYTVSYGVLVGLAAKYSDADALSLTAEGKAPENAALYMPKTTEAMLSLTVYWPEAVQNEQEYQRALRFRGFVTLTDADGNKTYYTEAQERYTVYGNEKVLSAPSVLDLARYLVCEREITTYAAYELYQNAGLRKVLQELRYSIPYLDEAEDAVLLLKRQYELKKGLDEALAMTDIRVVGEDTSLGTPSIWVEYLADSAGGDKRIRPAYIYFPTVEDPTLRSDADLKKEGVYRVFCYIGMPSGKETVPGILCVHGGGGHAYINYVKEAVNHGYAAIAIDADGYTRSDPTAADSSGGYTLDYFGMAKDSLAESDRPIAEQWMYYVQRALIYANTYLRSMARVDETKVGITGISWGGLTTTIAIGYDTRYAFAVPVYLSGNMDESQGAWSADYFRKGLWYNDALLQNATMPVLILTGDEDKYASLDTCVLTYHDLPNASMCIIRGLGHSQQRGASLSEIYTFADAAIGLDTRMPLTESTPDATSGSSYTLQFAENALLSDYSAVLYYLTEPVTYGADGTMRTEWQEQALTVDENGTVRVEVPKEACIYYISFSAYNEQEKKMPRVYYQYTGYVTSSTPLICMNGDIYR